MQTLERGHKMEKSCENCLHFGNPRCTTCNDLDKYKPDYPTLERENVKLIKSLERACEWIMQYADETGDCYACPRDNICNCSSGSNECKQNLIQHFKGGIQ
jgi:hypothetical protein